MDGPEQHLRRPPPRLETLRSRTGKLITKDDIEARMRRTEEKRKVLLGRVGLLMPIDGVHLAKIFTGMSQCRSVTGDTHTVTLYRNASMLTGSLWSVVENLCNLGRTCPYNECGV